MLTRTALGRTYTYSHSVGRLSNAGLGFRFPRDLAIGPGETIYVLSRGDGFTPASPRVTKLNMDEEFILDFGSLGAEDGQFIEATALAVDKVENIFVADEWLNRISIFDKDGSYLHKWGVPGTGEGEMEGPGGLAFDKDDNLWIVDTGNNRIQQFTKDGGYLSGWGRGGTGEGEFDMPWGIAIDHLGDIYVADWQNRRVQKFDPSGRYLMSFGAPGSGEGELDRPTGVAIDEEGDVYVSDWSRSVVHAYQSDGGYITTFVGDAQNLTKWAQQFVDSSPDTQKARRHAKDLESEWRLYYPVAIAVDDKRRIIIVDEQRHRLQLYIKELDYVEPQFNL